MKLNATLVAFLALGVLISVDQVRAVTQVASPAQLTGPLTIEDFEDDTFVSGVTFSASSGIRRGDSDSYSDGVTTSGVWGLSTFATPDQISMDFAPAQPAKSVGLYFGDDDLCCSTGFTAFLDIYGASGLLNTIGVTANMNDFVDQFLGFNSDDPVTSLTLRYGSGSDVDLFLYIDDFQFSLVPEPSSIALLMIGLGALGLARRPFANDRA